MYVNKWTPWLGLFLVTSAYAQGTEQVRRATITGSRGDYGKCTIEVRVDVAAEVEIRGDSARLRTFGGQPATWTRMECTDPLPASMADFHFKGVDGRGSQRLIQDPRNNRGVAVIRIEDPKGGAEAYTFDIEWGGPVGGVNNGSIGNRGGGNRFSTDQAIDTCRTEVRARGERDYNLRNIQVNSVAADRGQGRREWVNGTFTSRGGEYRFNCLLDYNSGQVRTLEILRPDGGMLAPGGQPRYDRNAVLRACQDAVVARVGRDGYGNVHFASTVIDNRRDDFVSGELTASRGPVGDRFDFSCTMDFNNSSVRSVDVRRR
jgi:hypothetical protein